MRTTIAIIKLMLKTGKTLSDGTHPIMLYAAFGGKKTISTGYSCDEKHWDKKTESVKKGFPNYVAINQSIHKLKSEAIDRRNEFEKNGTAYTPSMLLEKREALTGGSLKVVDLYREYIQANGLKKNTIKNWVTVINLLTEFKGKGIIITEIDSMFMSKFVDFIKSKRTMKDSSIYYLISKIGALQNWCIMKGLMSDAQYCFKSYKFKMNKDAEKVDFVNIRTLPFIKQHMSSLLYSVDSVGLISYNMGVIDALNKRSSSEFALYFWCMGCFVMSGLSPVDLCLLKKSQLERVVINGKDYWSVRTHRVKTGMPVHFIIDCSDDFCNAMVNAMLLFNEGEYLMPVLNGVVGDLDHLKDVVGNNSEVLNEKIVGWWKCINNKIIQWNVDHNDNVPLIDIDFRMYSYRHSFAMAYISMSKGNIIGLGALLGHGKNLRALHHYVKLLQSDEDLALNMIKI